MNHIVSASDILAQAAQARGQGASQAVAIEQSRVVAEVQSAFLMAQHRPRDRARALNEALESCRTREVAESAFFKFSRGGSSVAGESIHLARELARCWGNIFYTIAELDRDETRHRSEMVAYAIDLETNTQARLTFMVPHSRDTKGGAKALTDMRDIYENNANMGARRLRECIFAVLPPYLIKSAAEQCRATLESGEDEKPLTQRVAEAVSAFEKIGVSKERIEAKLGPVSGFTAVDIANLQISYKSIRRNEISADEEFPRVEREDAAAEIRAGKKKEEPKPENIEPNDGTLSPDNPTAAEGPADEQRGEAHTDDRPQTAKQFADAHIARINAADTTTAIAQLAQDYADDLERMGTAAPAQRERIRAAERARWESLNGDAA